MQKTVVAEPEVKPAPTAPDIDPDTRLNPDKLCPSQGDEVIRRIRENV